MELIGCQYCRLRHAKNHCMTYVPCRGCTPKAIKRREVESISNGDPSVLVRLAGLPCSCCSACFTKILESNRPKQGYPNFIQETKILPLALDYSVSSLWLQKIWRCKWCIQDCYAVEIMREPLERLFSMLFCYKETSPEGELNLAHLPTDILREIISIYLTLVFSGKLEHPWHALYDTHLKGVPIVDWKHLY